MAEKPERVDLQRGKSGGRRLVSVGISLLMMMDYIFHNRREIPVLIVKARKPAVSRTHTFEMPEPLPPSSVARPSGWRSRRRLPMPRVH
jgi:hypothetical protein